MVLSIFIIPSLHQKQQLIVSGFASHLSHILYTLQLKYREIMRDIEHRHII
jgi:hypothetical protein